MKVSLLNKWDNKDNCFCDDITYDMILGNAKDSSVKIEPINSLTGQYFYLGFGMEKYTSPEKCFDFWANHSTYLGSHSFNSLQEVSLFIFGRRVEDLSRQEMITLIKRIGHSLRQHQTKN